MKTRKRDSKAQAKQNGNIDYMQMLETMMTSQFRDDKLTHYLKMIETSKKQDSIIGKRPTTFRQPEFL